MALVYKANGGYDVKICGGECAGPIFRASSCPGVGRGGVDCVEGDTRSCDGRLGFDLSFDSLFVHEVVASSSSWVTPPRTASTKIGLSRALKSMPTRANEFAQ